MPDNALAAGVTKLLSDMIYWELSMKGWYVLMFCADEIQLPQTYICQGITKFSYKDISQNMEVLSFYFCQISITLLWQKG